jgi:hypothetical protein
MRLATVVRSPAEHGMDLTEGSPPPDQVRDFRA